MQSSAAQVGVVQQCVESERKTSSPELSEEGALDSGDEEKKRARRYECVAEEAPEGAARWASHEEKDLRRSP